MAFKIVYILRKIGEKNALVLQKSYEGVGRREFLGGWKNVFSDRVEYARILAEETNVKDLLGITQA